MHKLYWLLAVPFAAILLFSLPGCLKLTTNPVMPQWNVDLNIPIVDTSYSLADIIKKQNYISVLNPNSSNSIFLIQSDTYSISKDVSSFVQALGNQSASDSVVSGTGQKTIYVAFPDGANITNAVFSSGTLRYSFNNPSSQAVSLTLTIPGITLNGTVFSKTIQISSFGSNSGNINFSGAVYQLPSNQPSVFQNQMEVVLEATSSITSTVNFTLTTSDFYFSSATGYLPAKSLGVKSSSFGLNISNAKDYRDKVTLDSAEVVLDAKYIPASSNNNPFPIEVKNLTITGIRNDGTTLQLNIPASAQTFIFSGTAKQFVFDKTNSNINDFMSFLPDSVNVSAEYIINPNNATGTVAAGDSVKFQANFSTKSYLAISSSSLTDTSSSGNLNSSNRTKIKACQSAYLSVNVQNGIPLDASVSVDLVDSNYVKLFTLQNKTDNTNSFSVLPAGVDANGNVTSQTTSNFTVQLDSAETDKLSQAYYAVYTVTVNTPGNPTPVAIRPTDEIHVQVYGGITFQVNQDNLK